MSLTDLPSPPRIPVSGADNRDVEATVKHIELLTQLFKSAVLENAAKYREAVLRALVNHNENVEITRTVRLKSFTYGLEANLEDFIAATNDLNSDVVGDVERALEE